MQRTSESKAFCNPNKRKSCKTFGSFSDARSNDANSSGLVHGRSAINRIWVGQALLEDIDSPKAGSERPAIALSRPLVSLNIFRHSNHPQNAVAPAQGANSYFHWKLAPLECISIKGSRLPQTI